MKIAKVVRDLHAECDAIYQRLAKDVNERLKPRVEAQQWFYISRVKQLQSYALKLETGRVADPRRPDDFFACTIVVSKLSEIEEAERLVNLIYIAQSRRPPVDGETHKASSSFAFDDLRLYVAQPESTTGKDPDLDGLIFEVQIKTILQHAWSIATHDLIYKTNNVSWARERIAFQIKAMLEHAEIAIVEANRLAETPAVAKVDKPTAEIFSLIETIGKIWTNDLLPDDRKRLAESIRQTLRICDLNADSFQGIIEIERRRVNVIPSDLSPYAFTIQALTNNPGINFQHKFGRPHIKTTIVVHEGIELPEWMACDHPRILRL